MDLNDLDLNSIDVEKLTEEQKYDLYELITEYEAARTYENKFWKNKSFKPYPFQKQFFNAGAKHKVRFLMAGNRVGKSFSEAQEFSWHATGLYPTMETHGFDWEGHRFIKSEMKNGEGAPMPHDLIMWAVGITGDSTRKVLQKELFGTESARMEEELGTGSIPRHLINLDQIDRDGNKILTAKVKHHDEFGEFDGWTTIEFRSSAQGEASMMGANVDFIWMDEEPEHNSIDIYAQCVTRTSTTSGHVVITATPEAGRTPLVNMFLTDKAGELYLQRAGWDHITHISEEEKKRLLASIPKWQHALRTQGEPILGEGMVYATECGLDSILCPPMAIPDSWNRVCAIDIGFTHDTAVVWSAYDALADTIYIYDCYASSGGTPSSHAHAIRTRGDWIPVILPHDADNTERGSGQSVASFYRQAGVNTMLDTFYNPLELTGGKENNFVMVGITDILDRMNTGRFKVFDTPNNAALMDQIRTYQFKNGKIKKEDDDLVDAMRYSGCSVRHRGKSKMDHDNDGMLYYNGSNSSYGGGFDYRTDPSKYSRW